MGVRGRLMRDAAQANFNNLALFMSWNVMINRFAGDLSCIPPQSAIGKTCRVPNGFRSVCGQDVT